MLGWIVALISGALMSVQGVFNTQTTKASSIWIASSFVQFTALLVCLIAWAVTDRSSLLTVFQVKPKYMLLGGAIGAFRKYSQFGVKKNFFSIKAGKLSVISQLLIAYIIELLGMFGVERQPLVIRKVIGIVVAIAGFIVFKWD